MRLFLDTSVLLAASGSAAGASREIFRRAAANGWLLVSSPYVIEEGLRNLPTFPPLASAEWARLRPELLLMDEGLDRGGHELRNNYFSSAINPACSKCLSPVSASVIPSCCITKNERQSVNDQLLSCRCSKRSTAPWNRRVSAGRILTRG